MKILIMPSWYPNNKNLISGIFIKEQVKALKEVGITPVVFFPYDATIVKDKLIFNYEEGIGTYRANTEYLSKVGKLKGFLKIYPMMKKIVKDEEIKLIHAHVCYTAGIMAYIFNIFNSKVPYVITEHRSSMGEFSAKFYNKAMFKLSYLNASKVVCVSKYLKNELEKLGYKFNGEVIGNVVNVTKYALKKKDNKNSIKKLLFVGSMAENEVKGIQYFIPALANYVKKNPKNIKVTFIGDGINRVKYENMCKELKVDDICNFIGIIPKENIPMYMENNDILVLPSVKETFGSVIIEAMACGLPVLATKCGGPCEIINDKLGVLVPSMNVNALEEGLKHIILTYDSFDSNYIRKYVIDNYSYEAIGEKLKRTYMDII